MEGDLHAKTNTKKLRYFPFLFMIKVNPQMFS
jgi:hypothetical protein